MANNVGNFQDSGTLYPVTTQKVSGAVTNSTAVTLTASNSGIAVGQVVTGPGIPNADGINLATTVAVISSTSLTLSRPATLVDGVTLNFASYQNQNIETDFVWGNHAIQPNDDRATTAAGNYAVTGVTTPTIASASSDGKLTTFTTSAAHGLAVGQTVNTGIYAIGGTVAAPTAGTTVSAQTGSSSTVTLAAATPTADVTQRTVTLATSAAHNISVGELVTITGGLTTAAVYNGTFTALAGTTGSTLVVANAVAAIASPAATTTDCSVAVNHFDVNNATVVSVPSTTTFTVAQTLPNIGSVNPTGKTATLEVAGDRSWSITSKTQSARLNTGTLTTTINGNSYVTNTYDGQLVDSGFYGFPNFNTGKYQVTAAQAGGTVAAPYVLVTASNNFAEVLTLGTSTVNLTGFTNPAFNINGAIVRAATADNFVVSGTVTTQVGGNGSTSQVGVTLTAANNAIQVGQSVVISGSVVATVAAISGTALTLSTAVSVANSTTITFLAPLGTALTAQSAAAQVVGWGIGNFNVTAAAVDAVTNTRYIYTAQNTLNVGDVVTITGLTNSTFNVASQTVAAATATSFTLASQTASTAGLTITGQVGKVEYSSALANVDGAYSAGAFGYLVPDVRGKAFAVAEDALNDRGIVPTNSGNTSSSSSSVVPSAVSRTAGSNLAIITTPTHTFVAGQTVTLASVDASVNGDQTVLFAPSTTTLLVATSGTTVLALTGLSGGTCVGKVGTVISTATAAGGRVTSPAVNYARWT
jgi:hypothetical protein